MALFIAQTDGTTDFRVDQVEVDVISISLVDMGVGFDEPNPQVFEGVTTIPVTYTQNETGPTADRLNALVNDVGFTSPPNIIVFGVDDSFSLSDGTPLKGNGIAIPPGGSGNPFSSHVAAFYDVTLCGGAGVWVDKEGGGTMQQTTDEILFHELSHCFHFVTGTTASTSAQEEVNAETDENEMHDVRGAAHRDVNSHNGGCGGGDPGCCIIASLSTGSPFSREVNRLRYVREHALRCSEVGDDFFKAFFYSYYSFSPEVCRLMGHHPELRGLIKGYFVVPLLGAFELFVAYVENRGTGLAELLVEQAQRPELAAVHTPAFQKELDEFLGLAQACDLSTIHEAIQGRDQKFACVSLLLKHVNQKVMADQVIRWSLLEMLRIWLAASALVNSGHAVEDCNRQIYRMVSEWISLLPITAVWKEFSRLQTEEELALLGHFIFDPGAKLVFARRLVQEHPRYATTINSWAAA
jgi:hypothetical protein